MKIFEDKKIARVVYTNPSHDTIEVLYDPDGTGKSFTSYYIPTDNLEHETLNELFDLGYTFEKILVDTKEHNQKLVDMFHGVHRKYAELELKKQMKSYERQIETAIVSDTITKTNLISTILEFNADEEFLFRTKLAIFDIPEIKNSKNRELKQRLRISKSLLELISTLSETLDTIKSE